MPRSANHGIVGMLTCSVDRPGSDGKGCLDSPRLPDNQHEQGLAPRGNNIWAVVAANVAANRAQRTEQPIAVFLDRKHGYGPRNGGLRPLAGTGPATTAVGYERL